MTYPAIPDGPAPIKRSPKKDLQSLRNSVEEHNRKGALQVNSTPAFFAYQTVATTLPQNTWEAVGFQVAEVDTDGMFKNGHCQIQRAGLYQVSARLVWNKTTLNGEVLGAISTSLSTSNFLSGTEDSRPPSQYSWTTLLCGPRPVHLNAGDTLYVFAFQNPATSNYPTDPETAGLTSSISVVGIQLD